MDKNNPANIAAETHNLDVDLGTSPPFHATGPYITDSDGNEIDSESDYKLMMSDGTELGMDAGSVVSADQSPSNSGAIIKFSSTPKFSVLEKWPNYAFKFIRGVSYRNGALVKGYLDMVISPDGTYPIVWVNNINPVPPTRFLAVQMPGNRVSLHVELRSNPPTQLGIRLNGQKNLLEGDKSDLKLPLAAQFVKVQTLPKRIVVP